MTTAPILFFFKQKTAYEITTRLVGSEMCIRDRWEGRRPTSFGAMTLTLTLNLNPKP